MSPVRHPADGRVHFSELKLHAFSPAHVKYACECARTITRPMRVGYVTDQLVFSGDMFRVFDGDRRAKNWLAFEAICNGANLMAVTKSEAEDAHGAAQAVLDDPDAKKVLAGCDFQRVAQWDAWGLPCAAGIAGERGGFDALNESAGYIVDLKVTATTQPEALSRHAFRMHWHSQGAWYLSGAEALGLSVRDFYLLCVESSPPHCVTIMRVPDEALELGRRSITLWTERHKQCEEAGVWPGYSQVIVDLMVPDWLDYVDDVA